MSQPVQVRIARVFSVGEQQGHKLKRNMIREKSRQSEMVNGRVQLPWRYFKKTTATAVYA